MAHTVRVAVGLGKQRGARTVHVTGTRGLAEVLPKLAERAIEQTTEYIGVVKSRQSTAVQPEVEGIVTRIQVRSGDRVAPGTALLEISSGHRRKAPSWRGSGSCSPGVSWLPPQRSPKNWCRAHVRPTSLLGSQTIWQPGARGSGWRKTGWTQPPNGPWSTSWMPAANPHCRTRSTFARCTITLSMLAF